jgi:signal peptide peptidase SppA
MTMGSNDHIEVPDPVNGACAESGDADETMTASSGNTVSVSETSGDDVTVSVGDASCGWPPAWVSIHVPSATTEKIEDAVGHADGKATKGRCSNLIGAVMSDVWAIQQAKLDIMMEMLNARQEGRFPALAETEAVARRERPETVVRGSIAVMPLFGIMAQRMNMVVDFSGGTSTTMFGQAFDALMDDPAIGAIVLDVDSPGGSVFGLEELSKKIFAARGKKKLVAVANSLMASAAYYVATAAEQVYVTPGGQVGSVGTLAIHGEGSKADEAAGFRYTLIRAGEYKAEGNPYEPLGDEARNEMQRRVNGYYDMFVAAVARHRGVTKTVVQRDYGQGRVLMAKDAKEAGMVDGIATLEQVIGKLAKSQNRQSTMQRAIAKASKDLPNGK